MKKEELQTIVVRNIKQITSLAPGWRVFELIGDNNLDIFKIEYPVIGWGIVEKYFVPPSRLIETFLEEEKPTETKIELIIYDRSGYSIVSFEEVDLDSINTIRAMVPPGEELPLEDMKEQLAKKMGGTLQSWRHFYHEERNWVKV